MPGRDVAQGGEKRYLRDTEGPGRKNPWRLSGIWVQSEVGKGSVNGRGTTADTGTRRRAQRQAADSGGGRLCTTSRWKAFCAGRGGGERV